MLCSLSFLSHGYSIDIIMRTHIHLTKFILRSLREGSKSYSFSIDSFRNVIMSLERKLKKKKIEATKIIYQMSNHIHSVVTTSASFYYFLEQFLTVGKVRECPGSRRWRKESLSGVLKRTCKRWVSSGGKEKENKSKI